MFSKIWFKKPLKYPASQNEAILPPAIPGILPVKSVDELLSPHAGCIAQIDELAGLSKAHFQLFYRHPIWQFARWVQLLPASEVHHHAGPGGMLAHGLEVCINALKRRRSYLLSESGHAEEISAKQDLWTYAVFMAALCHDLAKVAVDQRITIYDEQRRAVVWEPWHQFIDEQGQWYTTEFVRHQQYRLHEKATPLLVHRIIPSQGMSWLANDPHILSQWLACVSGDLEHAAMIGEIVSLADQQSVAVNLGADSTRMSGVKTKPLHEKMLTALRFLLTEGELPLNRNGAAGWIQGDDCWLVSKRTVDAIRVQLISEGHSGIPTKNGRLFDVLQEHGILIPCGDRAIWSATVEGEGWRNELTLIKIPVTRLWPNPAVKPDNFEGHIRPLMSQPAQSTEENLEKDPDQTLNSVQKIEDAAVKDTVTADQSESVTQAQQQPDADKSSESEASDLLSFLPSCSEPEIENSSSQTQTAVVHNQNHAIDHSADYQNSQNLSLSPLQPAGEQKMSHPDASADPVVQFFDWLQTGILHGQLKFNQAKARVHVVDEGVILVTSGIFQDFARSSVNTHNLAWAAIQQKILKKNWHVRDAKGLNVIRYRLKGQSKSTAINAVLFHDKTRVFGGWELPTPNPHLMRDHSISNDN